MTDEGRGCEQGRCPLVYPEAKETAGGMYTPFTLTARRRCGPCCFPHRCRFLAFLVFLFYIYGGENTRAHFLIHALSMKNWEKRSIWPEFICFITHKHLRGAKTIWFFCQFIKLTKLVRAANLYLQKWINYNEKEGVF